VLFRSYTGTGATPISKLENDNSINVQSVSLTLPLSRTPIERLGSKFAFTRVVDFPIAATMNVSAILSDTESRSLSTMLDDNTKRDITLTIKKPGVTGQNAMVFSFKGSQLQSESFSSSIGANKTVDLVFQTQVGGPSDTVNGVYLSGSYTETNLVGDWGQS
jgi:PIN domain nuclease of toxin-antitoxin system